MHCIISKNLFILFEFRTSAKKFKNSNCGPQVVEHSLFGLSHHLPTMFVTLLI